MKASIILRAYLMSEDTRKSAMKNKKSAAGRRKYFLPITLFGLKGLSQECPGIHVIRETLSSADTIQRTRYFIFASREACT